MWTVRLALGMAAIEQAIAAGRDVWRVYRQPPTHTQGIRRGARFVTAELLVGFIPAA